MGFTPVIQAHPPDKPPVPSKNRPQTQPPTHKFLDGDTPPPPPFSPDTTLIILDQASQAPNPHSLQISPNSAPPPTPSSEHILSTWGRTHTHGFSLGAGGALHAWQPLIPFLTSFPRGADEAN